MELLLFSLFSLTAIFGAIVVVTASDPFTSALSLIVHFVSLGALYLVLHAPFVAIAQVIVYAGAVVVLFLFVLAYLGDNRELVGSASRARMTRPVGIVLAMLTVGVVGFLSFWGAGAEGVPTGADVPEDFGTTVQIGEAFLTRYLLEFEVTSLVLLVAAIGGIVLGLTGRARHDRLRAALDSMSADQMRARREELRRNRGMGELARGSEVRSSRTTDASAVGTTTSRNGAAGR